MVSQYDDYSHKILHLFLVLLYCTATPLFMLSETILAVERAKISRSRNLNHFVLHSCILVSKHKTTHQ